MGLVDKTCEPCEGGVDPMNAGEVEEYLKQVDDHWQAFDDKKKIRRTSEFEDFGETMGFVNRVAEIADQENHHPDLHVFYGTVKVVLWTHAIGGVSENDFIVAAKIDRLV